MYHNRFLKIKTSKELLGFYRKMSTSNNKNKDIMNLTKEDFWLFFKIYYKKVTNKVFIKSEEALQNLKPLALYFLKENEFCNCINLETNNSKPSLKKGLLIVGKVGNGKTTYMKVIREILKRTKNKTFVVKNCKQIVLEFESCNNQNDKAAFYNKYTRGVIMFDDIGSENKASNFGIVNVIKEILSIRYEKQLLTHGTSNLTLENIREKYDMRTEDRFYDMFNIVRFEGRSMRGLS